MADSNRPNRRTVLRTLGSLGIASPFASSASAGRSDSNSPHADADAHAGTDCSAHADRPDRSDDADRPARPERPDRTAHEDRPDRTPRHPPEARAQALANRPGRYLAVVDRIVDGRHAVLLLEDGDELVGQLVVSPDELPDVAERDVLLVTLTDDDDLESARRLDGETERRKRELEDRFDSLAE
ncbi:DUF3006 family protein [Halobacteria archaeon AArc-m2/3/4]|uniref:DUF3006 family protein n=1 Tax=Natronoglomus mannanivorans TaxID=2979990 RepID=A0AAP3E0U9_9EURY|nr:DUF3006 family protein [Halobacteria archaeon AArc-xg1-1]MCU4972602.1 DUF3006 family protein [Halobacteria archaeon AArc-m2/3/4]